MLLESGPDPIFKFAVTNTGNVTLSGVTLSDSDFDLNGAAPGTTIMVGGLAPGATVETTFTAPWQSGQHTDSARASGSFTDDAGNTTAPSDTDDANYFGGTPGVRVVTSVNGQNADSPTGPHVPFGSTVTFTYVVTNAGNVVLANVTVTDDKLGAIAGPASGDTNNDGLLDLTETWTYTKTATALVGQQTNVGTVDGGVSGTSAAPTDNDAANYFGDARVVAFSGAMEGGLKFQPGAIVNAGFHFHVEKNQPAFVETVQSRLVLPVHCGSAKGVLAGVPITFKGQPSRGIVVDMGLETFSVAANSTKWIPTDDKDDILGWMSSIAAPNLCGGATMYNSEGAELQAAFSEPPAGRLYEQFHYRIPAAKGKPDTDCTDVLDPNLKRDDVCGAGWSSSQSFQDNASRKPSTGADRSHRRGRRGTTRGVGSRGSCGHPALDATRRR
jgi:hypothetical protein